MWPSADFFLLLPVAYLRVLSRTLSLCRSLFDLRDIRLSTRVHHITTTAACTIIAAAAAASATTKHYCIFRLLLLKVALMLLLFTLIVSYIMALWLYDHVQYVHNMATNQSYTHQAMCIHASHVDSSLQHRMERKLLLRSDVIQMNFN